MRFRVRIPVFNKERFAKSLLALSPGRLVLNASHHIGGDLVEQGCHLIQIAGLKGNRLLASTVDMLLLFVPPEDVAKGTPQRPFRVPSLEYRQPEELLILFQVLE